MAQQGPRRRPNGSPGQFGPNNPQFVPSPVVGQQQPAAKKLSVFTVNNLCLACSFCVVFIWIASLLAGLTMMSAAECDTGPTNDTVNMTTVGNVAFVDYQCPDALAIALPNQLIRMQRRLDRDVPVVHVNSSTFAHGPLRVTTPSKIVFTESVVFEPNPNADWRPRVDQPQYSGTPFRLGFFGGIIVESNDVMIDLNHHTFSSSNVFMLQQKVFSLIELGPAPFTAGFGPAEFTNRSWGPSNVVIRNGVLGPSQHHCVHGNLATHVYIHDVTMSEYEVASVSINAGQNIFLRDVRATGHRVEVPVLGTYSQTRFITQFGQSVLDYAAQHTIVDARITALDAALAPLYAAMNDTVADVQASNAIDPVAHPLAWALFGNERRVPDGNVYGMVFHPIAPAVDSFWHEEPWPLTYANATGNIVMHRVYIDNVRTHVVEVVALSSPQHGVLRGPAGDVVRLQDALHKLEILDVADGTYVPNALSEAQRAFAEAAALMPPFLQERFFTLSFTPGVLAWMRGDINFADLLTQHDYSIIRNGDTMFHVNKGAMGIRIDGATNVCLDEVSIENVTNTADTGFMTALPGEVAPIHYVGPEDGGHPAQGPLQRGFMGADSRGLSIAATNNTTVRNVVVKNVFARLGVSRGLQAFNKAGLLRFGHNVSIEDTRAVIDETLTATEEYVTGAKSSVAVGVHVSGGSSTEVWGLDNVQARRTSSALFDMAYNYAVDAQEETYLPKSLAELGNTFTL